MYVLWKHKNTTTILKVMAGMTESPSGTEDMMVYDITLSDV